MSCADGGRAFCARVVSVILPSASGIVWRDHGRAEPANNVSVRRANPRHNPQALPRAVLRRPPGALQPSTLGNAERFPERHEVHREMSFRWTRVELQVEPALILCAKIFEGVSPSEPALSPRTPAESLCMPHHWRVVGTPLPLATLDTLR